MPFGYAAFNALASCQRRDNASGRTGRFGQLCSLHCESPREGPRRLFLSRPDQASGVETEPLPKPQPRRALPRLIRTIRAAGGYPRPPGCCRRNFLPPAGSAIIEWGKAAPRRRASEVASVRGESRYDKSGSLGSGDFARARRPLSAMPCRGSAVRLSAQTRSVDSRPRLLQLQRLSLGSTAMGVAHSDAEVWLLRLPPASGRRLAAGRRM